MGLARRMRPGKRSGVRVVTCGLQTSTCAADAEMADKLWAGGSLCEEAAAAPFCCTGERAKRGDQPLNNAGSEPCGFPGPGTVVQLVDLPTNTLITTALVDSKADRALPRARCQHQAAVEQPFIAESRDA